MAPLFEDVIALVCQGHFLLYIFRVLSPHAFGLFYFILSSVALCSCYGVYSTAIHALMLGSSAVLSNLVIK